VEVLVAVGISGVTLAVGSDVYVGVTVGVGVGVSDGAGTKVFVAVGTSGVKLAVGSDVYVGITVGVGVGVSDGAGTKKLSQNSLKAYNFGLDQGQADEEKEGFANHLGSS
jgi:hypothetical protein